MSEADSPVGGEGGGRGVGSRGVRVVGVVPEGFMLIWTMWRRRFLKTDFFLPRFLL